MLAPVLNWPEDFERLRMLCDKARERGELIAFANGCFDLPHAGHVDLTVQAHLMSTRPVFLVVCVDHDDSVRALKGPGRPLMPFAERARILSAWRTVAAVVGFSGATPVPLLQRLRPDVLIKGAEYTGQTVPGAGYCAHGVFLVDMRPEISTTGLLQRHAVIPTSN